jgi:hypothetical protein
MNVEPGLAKSSQITILQLILSAAQNSFKHANLQYSPIYFANPIAGSVSAHSGLLETLPAWFLNPSCFETWCVIEASGRSHPPRGQKALNLSESHASSLERLMRADTKITDERERGGRRNHQRSRPSPMPAISVADSFIRYIWCRATQLCYQCFSNARRRGSIYNRIYA